MVLDIILFVVFAFSLIANFTIFFDYKNDKKQDKKQDNKQDNNDKE